MSIITKIVLYELRNYFYTKHTNPVKIFWISGHTKRYNVFYCRFGCVSYQSKALTRKLKIKNISSIPVSVVWHVFRATKKSYPFNAVYDMHEVRDNEFEPELLITDKYYGDEVGADIFEVNIHTL